MNISTIINNLYTNRSCDWIKNINESEVAPFVIQRYLVMNDRIRVQTRWLDKYVFWLSPKMYLSLAWTIIPKTEKAPFVKFIKQKKENEEYDFILTKDNQKPIIMIAAGCGVAPFKAFLEERYLRQASGPNWLFFGEKYSDKDFHFKNFFLDLVDKNFLRLTTAFSRDQEDKIYVQDRILENGSDIWQWLHSDAIIYVCGRAKMAVSVEQKLLEIFIEEGNLSKEDSYEFFKQLIESKRYLKDVF